MQQCCLKDFQIDFQIEINLTLSLKSNLNLCGVRGRPLGGAWRLNSPFSCGASSAGGTSSGADSEIISRFNE